MKTGVLMVLAAGTILASAGSGTALAQYYQDGPGFRGDGPRRYYRERDYDDRRYYRERDRRYDRRQQGGYRTFNGCPPRYTIQDGVCKPYSGR